MMLFKKNKNTITSYRKVFVALQIILFVVSNTEINTE